MNNPEVQNSLQYKVINFLILASWVDIFKPYNPCHKCVVKSTKTTFKEDKSERLGMSKCHT